MSIMGFLKVFCLVVFGLLWAEMDEIVHVEESVEQGEFEVGAIRETLDPDRGSYAEVWADGSVSIVLPEQGSVTIEAREAYMLLSALYDHQDLLRQRANGTVPKEEPKLWLMSEQEVEALAERMEDEAILREMQEMVACTIAEGEEVLEQEEAEQWQTSGTCHLDERHTGRDLFLCDGCQRMACNQCGEVRMAAQASAGRTSNDLQTEIFPICEDRSMESWHHCPDRCHVQGRGGPGH